VIAGFLAFMVLHISRTLSHFVILRITGLAAGN